MQEARSVQDDISATLTGSSIRGFSSSSALSVGCSVLLQSRSCAIHPQSTPIELDDGTV